MDDHVECDLIKLNHELNGRVLRSLINRTFSPKMWYSCILSALTRWTAAQVIDGDAVGTDHKMAPVTHTAERPCRLVSRPAHRPHSDEHQLPFPPPPSGQ